MRGVKTKSARIKASEGCSRRLRLGGAFGVDRLFRGSKSCLQYFTTMLHTELLWDTRPTFRFEARHWMLSAHSSRDVDD